MIKDKKFIHQLLWLLAGILPWGFGGFLVDLLHHPADGHFLELSADGRQGLQGKSDTDLDRVLYRADAFCRGGDRAGLRASCSL
ncbi:Uncharacterised protein [Bacteroides xylanisolvens]|nr:Uncharacterised protein [Bacteroides xylanisolvens]